MTDAEQQELFARVERLERSAWRWRALASVLAVLFLLLLSLGLVSFVAFRNEALMRERRAAEQALDAERRARAVAEQEAVRALEAERRAQAAEAEARRRGAQGAKGQAEGARPRRPAGDNRLGP